MKKKTRNLILSIVVTLILLLTFTVTYAVFVYRQTGTNNQQLVLGDIYMHYKESNTNINIDNMMPINIADYTTYEVNPVMKTQAIESELFKCVSYFNEVGINGFLDEGSTTESFCKGTGTIQGGTTIQTLIGTASDENIQEMLSLNIIVLDGENYVINPIMATQTAEYENELTTCVSFFQQWELDEGSTSETYCQGSGTFRGSTFQEMFDNNYFNEGEKNFFYFENLITKEINLPYFEFTISGKNTYTKQDIYYEIVLDYGDPHEIRNTRLEDEFLRFRLVEVNKDKTETELFTNKSYFSIENKRIYIETIPKNTMNEINKTYRLYMWIDENVVIGNVNEDYTMEEWKDVFASVKVNVTGNFLEKELAYEEMYNITDESCFTIEELETTYTHNANMTEEELNACVTYITDLGFGEYQVEGETIESFCEGTGTTDSYTFQEGVDNGWFTEENLTYLEENNIIIVTEGVSITVYDVDTCGTDVVIPMTINGYNVTTIGESAFYDAGLTSVVIPDSVTTIGKRAFYDNNLTSVVIPDSVILIEEEAFAQNPLRNIEIGSNVNYIRDRVFNNYYHAGYLGILTKKVVIKGKTSLDDFKYYGEYVFAWGEGLSDDDIIFKP